MVGMELVLLLTLTEAAGTVMILGGESNHFIRFIPAPKPTDRHGDSG